MTSKQAFKMIKVEFSAKEDFPTRRFISRHFKETLASLTVLYITGVIVPTTKKVKFKLRKTETKGIPHKVFVPTPITQTTVYMALHEQFPNNEWVTEHYPNLIQRLASLYMLGTINPTVTKLDFGLLQKHGKPRPLPPQEVADRIYNQLMKTIKIEWDIQPRLTKFLKPSFNKEAPLEIDVKDLLKEMEQQKEGNPQ